MIRARRFAAAFAALTVAGAPALAAWPDDKPIEVVVGFAPGGGTDLMARSLMPFVRKRLGGSAALSDVPTAAEAGVKVQMSCERGRAAPKGVPAAIVKRLEAAVEESLKDPEFLSFISDNLCRLEGVLGLHRYNPSRPPGGERAAPGRAAARPAAVPRAGSRTLPGPAPPPRRRLGAPAVLGPGLPPERLPLLRDCDFLLGERASGAPSAHGTPERYVLCEINVSSVSPFPPSCIGPIVRALQQRRRAT